MGEELRLTVGPCGDGRTLAIITSGGHPQVPGSGKCWVLTLEDVALIPNGDTEAWFEQMKRERPWETRQ